jgi:integrase
MAGVRKRGTKWYAFYKDASGRQSEKVLPGVRTKTQARAEAAELEQRAFRVREHLEVAPAQESLEECSKLYLHSIRHQASHASTEGRWRLHILPALGAKPVGLLRPTDVEELLAAKRDEGYGQQTLRHLRVTLSAFFAWAGRKGLVTKNPVKETASIAVPEAHPKALTPQQVEALRDAAGTPLMRDLIWVAAHTALRPSELRRLTWDMVDLERRALVLTRSKTKRVRPVPLPLSLIPWLHRMRGERRGDFVFSTAEGQQLPASFQAAKRFKAALRAAGLVEGWELVCRRKGCGHREKSPTKGSPPCTRCGFALWPRALALQVSFKDLRSTAITRIVESTGDLRVAQLVAGHESQATTGRHYAAARVEHLQAQVDRAFASPVPVPCQSPQPKAAEPSRTEPTPPAVKLPKRREQPMETETNPMEPMPHHGLLSRGSWVRVPPGAYS